MSRRSRPFALLILLTAGCSLNYQPAEVEAGQTTNIPDTVALGVSYRVVKGSKLSLEVEAARAETYNDRHQTILSAQFSEYDTSGQLDTQGKADAVTFYSDTQDADVSGSVFVSSVSEKGSISADSLKWQNKSKQLTADPNELIVVRKDDGSYIAGRGFTGDFKVKQVQFSGPVEGTYMYDEK